MMLAISTACETIRYTKMNGNGGSGNSRVPFTRPIRPPVGKGGQFARPLEDIPGCTPRSFSIVSTDIGNDCRQIVSGLRRPADLHLGVEHSFDAVAHFFMGEVFAPVQLLQPLPDRLTKPDVMVEILLNQLLNIAVRVAAVLRRNEIQLRLDIGTEMHFHVTEDRNSGRPMSMADLLSVPG
jgi:hypothetical protein